jgi:hypothetical protein
LISAAVPAPVFASGANASTLVQADASELAPGDYRWDPSIAPDGAMTMEIDLESQRAFVYRDGMLIGMSTISSGKPGYETPAGTFTVLEKQKDHRSSKYDDAPMPYMQRLDWSGLALHAGHVRGHPASHGCVRLPMGFAKALYDEPTRGMKVVITGHAPGKEETVMASRQNARPNPQCCNRSHETGNLQLTKYWSRHSDSNAAPSPSTFSEGASSGEADEQPNSGDNGAVPSQLPSPPSR